MLVTISGPAGTGKSEIARNLIANSNYKSVILCTNRTPRPGEVHKKDYYFYDEEYLKFLEKSGKVMNMESYPGNRYYALPKAEIEKAVHSEDIYVLVCTPRGIREIEKEFGIDSIFKVYITSQLNVRAMRYIDRMGDKFSLHDLNELVNRSNMDYGKFDGFELEANLILDNSKDLTQEEMKEFVSGLQDYISSHINSKKNSEYYIEF